MVDVSGMQRRRLSARFADELEGRQYKSELLRDGNCGVGAGERLGHFVGDTSTARLNPHGVSSVANQQ